MVAGSSTKFPEPSEIAISGEGRGSKRLIKDTIVNVLASSANAVLSCEDLLTKILLLLPAFSLLFCKYVSKQWLSVITCPAFTLRHSQMSNIEPASSLFVPGPKLKRKRKSINVSESKGKSKSKRNRYEYDFISFDIRVPSEKSTVFKFGSEASAKILQSCNGLLLCYIPPHKFFVSSPCVNLFKMIPQPHMSKLNSSSFTGGIKLVFDPTKSLHYKVVHARFVSDSKDVGSYILIETYSSETGNWSVCADRIPSYQRFKGFHDGIYWNGGIHWLGYDRYVRSWHSKLDISVDPVLTTIDNPFPVDENLRGSRELFVSRGCLLFACNIIPGTRELRIFEMRNVNSRWSVKYHINLDDFMMPSPSTWGIDSSVLCIVLGEREEDSFMVIKSHGKVLQYKIILKTVCTLFDFGSTPRKSFPFVAS